MPSLWSPHDTQPLQASRRRLNLVQALAYALILLRENGVPSVFMPIFGASYEDTGGDGDLH